MDYLFCNICVTKVTSFKEGYFITRCNHFVCNTCLNTSKNSKDDRIASNKCIICEKDNADYRKVDNNLPNDIKMKIVPGSRIIKKSGWNALMMSCEIQENKLRSMLKLYHSLDEQIMEAKAISSNFDAKFKDAKKNETKIRKLIEAKRKERKKLEESRKEKDIHKRMPLIDHSIRNTANTTVNFENLMFNSNFFDDAENSGLGNSQLDVEKNSLSFFNYLDKDKSINFKLENSVQLENSSTCFFD
uniref:RING-type domain-containing protein n=1 Tax=Parastrongyloides trichosuri TaxID=131310 RepID=A0A0N4ZMD5_PARTI